MNPLQDFEAESNDDDDEYTRGLWTVGFITLLFATRTPVLKWAFASGAPPPVLLVNASVSLVALVWLLLGYALPLLLEGFRVSLRLCPCE